jgi:hypothetical protein
MPTNGNHHSQEARCYKRCNVCRTEWSSRDDFVGDPGTELVGYQVNFVDLERGLFLFGHSCGTTLALSAAEFTDLYDGPIAQSRRTGEADCPGHCLRHDDLEPCPAHCECAFVRELLQTLRRWPKTDVPRAGAHGN